MSGILHSMLYSSGGGGTGGAGLIISQDTEDYNLIDYLLTTSWNPGQEINLTIEVKPGVFVSSSNKGIGAMTFGVGIPPTSKIHLKNFGTIIGKGGNGGAGGNSSHYEGYNGGGAGDAIDNPSGLELTITNSFLIAGGGGGGGGGGKGSGSGYTGGGGGGGVGGGSGSGGGSSGTLESRGSGGGGISDAGSGGNGGNYGSSGGTGQEGYSFNGNNSGGSGGSKGKAVVGGTVIVLLGAANIFGTYP